jgi:hypothetical protein
MCSSQRVVGVVGLALILVVLSGTVGGQTGNLGLEVTSTDAEPGGEVTIVFNAANEGAEPTGAIVNVTARPDWEVVNRTDVRGLWRGDEKWLFQTIPSESSVSPKLTLSVPEDATGKYTVSARLKNSESSTSAETSIDLSTQTSETNTQQSAPITTGDETPSGNGPGFGILTIVIAIIMSIALMQSQN